MTGAVKTQVLAVGTAAAMAVAREVAPRDVPIRQL
jgi:hypothetical protein